MTRLPAGSQHRFRQFQAARTAFGKDLALSRAHAQPVTFRLDEGQLLRQVIREAIDGDHHRHTVLPQVFHMGGQVAQARRDGRGIGGAAAFLIAAAIVAQRPHGDHQNGGRRGNSRRGAFDIEEFFGAEIAAEAGLGHGVIGQGERQPGGPHRIAAMGDIGEGAAVHQAGGVLQRLHQVGPQGLPQQGSHGALGLEIVGKDRFALHGVAHKDAAQPLPQVFQVFGKAQNSHDLAGDADLEAIEAGGAVGFTAQTDLDFAQGAVVHIHAAAEHNAFRIEPQGIALMDVVIDEGGKEVIGGGDGVDIAGKVQVDLLHGEHLGVAAARGAALETEHGAEGGFPQGDDGVFS